MLARPIHFDMNDIRTRSVASVDKSMLMIERRQSRCGAERVGNANGSGLGRETSSRLRLCINNDENIRSNIISSVLGVISNNVKRRDNMKRLDDRSSSASAYR
jgi:hypothetical protein